MALVLPKAAEKLPPLYDTENVPFEEKTVYFYFMAPFAGWAWIPVEYEKETGVFFGYVVGHEKEWGYFNKKELHEIDHEVTPISTVVYAEPKRFGEVLQDLEENENE